MRTKCIFLARHTAKKMKNVHFSGPFLQKRGYGSIFYSFFFHSQFQFWEKWKQNEMENDLKMSEKWTENANCERPYSSSAKYRLLWFLFLHVSLVGFILPCCTLTCRTDTHVVCCFILCFTHCFTYHFTYLYVWTISIYIYSKI